MACKHFTQFSKDEVSFATGFIRNRVQPRIDGVKHFHDKTTDRHFTLGDAAETLRVGTVIEVHNDNKMEEWRAAVRSRNGTCVVVSLESNRVIAIYYNDPQDNHDTLNHNLYHGGSSIDVVAVVKNLLFILKRRQNENPYR